MNSTTLRVLAFLVLFTAQSLGLSIDGFLLLSFKNRILNDPFGVLKNWSRYDATPCLWNGVTCGVKGTPEVGSRVTGLGLMDSGLVGSIPSALGRIEYLRYLNLSNNSFNGSIPAGLFTADSKLEILDFSDNLISGELPELVGKLKNLRVLDLSDNALLGNLPRNLTALRNLTRVSLKNNYFLGSLIVGFDSVRVLDLSSNLINGSLPPDFGGANLAYLNVSFNRISGDIPAKFASKIPPNATIDLSFNNLTGEIPEYYLFFNQEALSYSGNPELCGEPLKIRCPIPSSAVIPLHGLRESPPALAAIPKIIESDPSAALHSADNGTETESSPQEKGNRLRMPTILGIVTGDIVGIVIVAVIFVYVYHLKRRKKSDNNAKEPREEANDFDWASSSSSPQGRRHCPRAWVCLKNHRHAAGAPKNDAETSSECTNSSESCEDPEKHPKNQEVHAAQERQKGELVTFDGEKELEMESLLKASAYILGASGSSIMYKAVLEDGTTLAVRRIGESGLDRFRDFQNQVRVIAKLVHPNLVRIRGFYWGSEEKLVIYDFVPNGSLANARYRKACGSSPSHLSWEIRLKIAKGVARGLCYIHEKKHVHGNLKPTNILLGADMEPKISDFGLERLVASDENSSRTTGGSARNFGSKRSTASRDSFQDYASGATPSPSPSTIGVSPYHSPESLRSLKPNSKWDVFAFGVVLLELVTGKVVVATDEGGLGLALGSATSAEDDRERVLRMADVAIRADLAGKEDALLAMLRMGYSCVGPVPQKRPSMKEVLHALDNFPMSLILNTHAV